MISSLSSNIIYNISQFLKFKKLTKSYFLHYYYNIITLKMLTEMLEIS